MLSTSAVVLPPAISVRSELLFNHVLCGMEIVGAPIGSVEFCTNFVKQTLDKMLLQSELLLLLHPQCATKLLKDCVSAAPHPTFSLGRILGGTGVNGGVVRPP